MKNDNQKLSLENFEALTEESNGTLVNGFSEALNLPMIHLLVVVTGINAPIQIAQVVIA